MGTKVSHIMEIQDSVKSISDSINKSQSRYVYSDTLVVRRFQVFCPKQINENIKFCKLLYRFGWRWWEIEINASKKFWNTGSINYKGFIRLRDKERRMDIPQDSTNKMVSMIDSLFINKKIPIYSMTKNKYGNAMSSFSEDLDVFIKCQNNYEYNGHFEITETKGGYDYVYSPTFERLLKMIFLYTVLYLGHHPGYLE